MSAGTLSLTNNNAVVTGTGTTFTTELAAGDFIVVAVGGVPYTLPVKSVDSATKLTLVSNYTGPTQVGAAWFAVPRVALNMVTAALVAQSAEALRGLNYDKRNWQQFFTADGDVTITLPDTSQINGPSAKKLISGMDGRLDKSQNLSDVADKNAARSNIGAAASANNSDIVEMSGVKVRGEMWNGRPAEYRGYYSEMNAPSDVVVKAFNVSVTSASWSLYTSLGFYTGGSDGNPGTSGAALTCTDGGAYTHRWVFLNNGGAISTAYGNINPVASDERVKNIQRVIDEDEAVEFIEKVKPIRFAYKWSPDVVRVGYSAQNIVAIDPELAQRAELEADGEKITDGLIIDAGEIGAAYLVPVVQQLLRRVAAAEDQIRKLTGD